MKEDYFKVLNLMETRIKFSLCLEREKEFVKNLLRLDTAEFNITYIYSIKANTRKFNFSIISLLFKL